MQFKVKDEYIVQLYVSTLHTILYDDLYTLYCFTLTQMHMHAGFN